MVMIKFERLRAVIRVKWLFLPALKKYSST